MPLRELLLFAIAVTFLGYLALMLGFFGGGYVVCHILIDNGFASTHCPIW